MIHRCCRSAQLWRRSYSACTVCWSAVPRQPAGRPISAAAACARPSRNRSTPARTVPPLLLLRARQLHQPLNPTLAGVPAAGPPTFCLIAAGGSRGTQPRVGVEEVPPAPRSPAKLRSRRASGRLAFNNLQRSGCYGSAFCYGGLLLLLFFLEARRVGRRAGSGALGFAAPINDHRTGSSVSCQQQRPRRRLTPAWSTLKPSFHISLVDTPAPGRQFVGGAPASRGVSVDGRRPTDPRSSRCTWCARRSSLLKLEGSRLFAALHRRSPAAFASQPKEEAILASCQHPEQLGARAAPVCCCRTYSNSSVPVRPDAGRAPRARAAALGACSSGPGLSAGVQPRALMRRQLSRTDCASGIIRHQTN